MMAALRQWLTAVTAVAMLLSIFQFLTPKGVLRDTASFIGGLILLIVLLRPVVRIDTDALHLDHFAYQQEIETRRAELAEAQNRELAEIIESKTETYISDQAKALGLTLQIQVTVKETGGVPVPYRVEITGTRSAALAAWLASELGVPAERQVWNEN